MKAIVSIQKKKKKKKMIVQYTCIYIGLASNCYFFRFAGWLYMCME
jgi:hypothetical protein